MQSLMVKNENKKECTYVCMNACMCKCKYVCAALCGAKQILPFCTTKSYKIYRMIIIVLNDYGCTKLQSRTLKKSVQHCY